MSNVIQFNFEQTYKEIEIGGKLYRMDMNDEAQTRVTGLLDKARQVSEEAKALDLEGMSADELADFSKRQRELSIEMVDTFLGEGTGAELYEVAGRSSVNMMKLVRQLQQLFEQFMGESYEDEKKKFVKKSK